MPGGQLPQPGGQLHRGPGAQHPPRLCAPDGRSDAGALSGDPVEMPQTEGERLALRSAPGNRDAHAAVNVHTQQVAPRPPVAHEIELNAGSNTRCRWVTRIGSKRQPKLHGDRIP